LAAHQSKNIEDAEMAEVGESPKEIEAYFNQLSEAGKYKYSTLLKITQDLDVLFKAFYATPAHFPLV
jgi:hypothetical protein